MTAKIYRAKKSGAVLPMVLLGTVLIAVIFLAFHQLSQTSRHRMSWSYDRMVAKNIAESALAMASAAIFQNDFETRWYKTTSSPNGKYGGFAGSYEGVYGGGNFKVVAEDVIIMDGQSVDSKQDLEEMTYNRIDLFAEGSYGNYKVVAYQALALMPEEKVYKAQGVSGEDTVYEQR